MIPPCEKEREW